MLGISKTKVTQKKKDKFKFNPDNLQRIKEDLNTKHAELVIDALLNEGSRKRSKKLSKMTILICLWIMMMTKI